MACKIDEETKKMEKLRISSTEEKAPDEFFPLKMVKDKKTEMYVKFAKVLVIVQGPCTKNREESSEKITTTFKYTSRVLSDKTFTEETRIPCSYTKAMDFYNYCQDASKHALEVGNNLLVIDSTMSNIEQNKYYVALAYKMQYVVLVFPPVVTKSSGHSWPRDSLAASFRNEGNTIIQPTNMFQHLFCAWYLHDVDSHELRHDAKLYIQDCIEEIPEFHEMINKNCLKMGPDGTPLSLIEAVQLRYNLTDNRQDLAFCCVKIFGSSMRLMNEYFKKQSVKDVYGKMNKLYITGYVFSPFIIAARVRLTHNQKDLWEMPEELVEEEVENSAQKPIGPWQLFEDSKKELPEVDVELISSKSNQTLINTGNTIHNPMESIHPFAKGRACHIVLGKAAGISSHHIDFGIQFALGRERAAFKAKAELPTYDLERCTVKRNGKYWFIYLKENMCIDALFSSCVKPYSYDHSIIC